MERGRTVTASVRLTSHQTAAVEAEAARLLLVASAGSGKTEVLTRRVLRVLERSRGDSFRILAVTFTVRAAQEMESRLKASLADEAWRVDCDTVHGFALSWLMRFGECVGIFPDTVVYSEDADRLKVLGEVIAGLGEPQDNLRQVLQAIDEARARSWTAEVDARNGPTVGSTRFEEVYDAYLASLDAAMGVDFPGMLIKFLQASDDDQNFIRNFVGTYRDIVVDEGQDLSPAQAAVVDKLSVDGIRLFVVADDRQSINAFAGGGFQNVTRLVGTKAATSALHLPHNFRCSTSILAAAESVASHLGHRPEQARAAIGAPVGAVRVFHAGSPIHEAELVSDWIGKLLTDGLESAVLADGEDPTVQAEDIAVIARSRWLLDPIMASLDAREITMSVQTDSQSAFRAPQARILIEGLALVTAPRNAPSLRRMAGELRAVGLVIDADASIESVTAALMTSDDDDLAGLSRLLKGATPGNLQDRLKALGDSAAALAWKEDLDSVKAQWSNYCATVQPHRRDLGGFLRFISRAQQTRPSDPGVRILTIHKVKGLEFKAVCLLGAYNGSIPDYRAITTEQVDEERRAFYVAMTRAARELVITYPETTTDRGGRSHTQTLSQFAVEAGLA
jgi:DNA helicase II / ATP-dependent DNA helicase PcrA